MYYADYRKANLCHYENDFDKYVLDPVCITGHSLSPEIILEETERETLNRERYLEARKEAYNKIHYFLGSDITEYIAQFVGPQRIAWEYYMDEDNNAIAVKPYATLCSNTVLPRFFHIKSKCIWHFTGVCAFRPDIVIYQQRINPYSLEYERQVFMKLFRREDEKFMQIENSVDEES